MPPESWCGWRVSTLRASGMRTSSIMRSASAMASLRDFPWCRRMDSAICSPTVKTGLSDVIGSWNTMAMSAPRTWRICALLALARSSGPAWRPRSSMEPLSIWPPPFSTRRISASEVTDLPEPDSPTTASVWPACTSKLRLLTTCTRPCSVLKLTDRSRTCNTAGNAAFSAEECARVDIKLGFSAQAAIGMCYEKRNSRSRCGTPKTVSHFGKIARICALTSVTVLAL